MGISPGKSGLARAADAASGQPAFFRSLHRKTLYCAAFLGMLAVCVVSPGLSVAQEDRPQISPDERKAPRKKEAGPRALAVLRLAANGKATLVPITILMSGKFYDASAYKAAPVPMALESGTVYEGVRTGSSLGLFTVDGALHSLTANSQSPWIGTGQWLAAGAEVKKTTIKAEDVPVGIETSDGPPRLSRGGSGAGATPPASTPPASTSPPTTPPASTTTTPPSSAPTNPPAGSSQPSSGSTAPPGNSKPANADDHSKDDHSKDDHAKDSKPADNRAGDSAKESDSGAGDNNRPRLRRGKPVDPLPDEEVPGYARPGAKPSTSATPVPTAPAADAGKTAASTLVPVQLIPAISDASGPQPRPFTFEWLKSEEGERRQQLTDFAKQQVRAYVDTLIKNRIVAKPLPQPAKRKSSKPAEPILEDAHMIAYDLWTNNQPIMIFSAQAHMTPTGSDPQAVADAETQYSIVIVARTDIYNNLHKLFLAVTDKNHLDITPRLELVDAVDVDGDNRGELLFREKSDAGGGWLIYRVTNDKLWKLFDSLNPE
jgi:hypothetical protein